jgi:hypothetical protein
MQTEGVTPRDRQIALLRSLALTAERRREVCVHEAAHAVVHAMGGSLVYRVAVAPEGSTAWTIQCRKGEPLADLLGVCETSDAPCGFYLRWGKEDGDYVADRARFSSMLRDVDRQMREHHAGRQAGRFAAEQRRQLRAHICGCMAGPAADAILAGLDVEAALDCWGVELEEGEDLTKAMGMARLLPFRNEYDHAARVTEEALRCPDVWGRVIRLADELYRVGSMDDVDPFLPQPTPGWPRPPQRRRSGTLDPAKPSATMHSVGRG